jgi:lipopolysaccharide transport system ATP-binding protein
MSTALNVHNLGKRYLLGARPTQSVTNLTERLTGGVRSLSRSLLGRGKGAWSKEFWALREISFAVEHGEVVGIIGRNGAGKSTLLKVLSRIIRPTEGKAVIHGRLGSLLEVGTGFHPELTGRENIYLNGSILGMRRTEIEKQFDAIVAFSGIEAFLDTPVKRYSSGMYVRLAFAVAAHLNPDILVVDEVLAVGDAAFQKQCLGKMRDVSRTGRTVLFVSHNMSAVESLCTRCISLKAGRIKRDGPPAEVIKDYLATDVAAGSASVSLKDHANRRPGSKPFMVQVSVDAGDTREIPVIQMGGRLSIRVQFDCGGETIRPVLGVVIKDRYEVAVFGINNRIVPGFAYTDPVRAGTISCQFASIPLMPGTYGVDLYLGEEQDAVDVDIITDAIHFDVEAADVYGSGKIPPPIAGTVFVPAQFSLQPR